MSYCPGGVSRTCSLREAWCNDHSENDDVEDDERPETVFFTLSQMLDVWPIYLRLGSFEGK